MNADYNRKLFEERGYLKIPGFYDRLGQIDPILECIRLIIELLCHKYGVEAATDTAESAMTVAFMALNQKSRAYGSEVYDAVKQIPAFLQLVSDPRNSRLYAELRPGSIPGVASGGYGIRIDIPGEDTFKAPWHQEFPAQLRSLDGVVFWTPLVSVTPSLGPVELCEGSHRDGIVPVYFQDGESNSGAYALRLVDEAERVNRYERQSPLTIPGDLIVMDFLTIHQSGENLDKYPRWSIQFRYFNFADPLGLKIAWQGSFAGGRDFRSILRQAGVQL